ncbi:ankyrin repeat domain-containing protein 45 isoform X1 [Scyliorhinus canicula]|uniref:ankyrin repeat domain-containing protein 45 isoform X1 n=1 Tax=Scyliorhinus canicula TaxID=7830 RepID=UPI0018F7C7E3|nr:ankyrin repeat domain-containing protein 45 isoform X1 [Scyliorhinus canicula]
MFSFHEGRVSDGGTIQWDASSSLLRRCRAGPELTLHRFPEGDLYQRCTGSCHGNGGGWFNTKLNMDPDGEQVVTELDNDDTIDNEDLELENRNNFLTSVLTGDTENLRKCFELLDEPNYKVTNEWLNIRDDFNRNALFAAAMLGHYEVITELVTRGADVNETTNRGYTPLHCAAAWGKLESLKTLVDLGANVQETNFRGEKARDIANRYSKSDCIEFLDWAESKLILEVYIKNIQETVADLEKLQGKLSKQDKATFTNACRSKSDWLNSAQNVSTQEFEEQRKQLELIMEPILAKLNLPSPQLSRSSRL